MIRLDEIEYLIKLCILSAFIEGERPVSAMLLAPPEHGKSELLKKFARIESVKITSDFNTSIFEEISMEAELGKIKTIIIPDFLRIVKKKYSTQANALTILNAITEEGWTGRLPLGRVVSKPVRMNVLTGLTRNEIIDKRHKWSQVGFMSRFLPISYTYKEETKSMIRSYIKARMYTQEGFHVFKVPENPISIALPENVANEIENITLDIAEKENIYGFRLERQLQTLALANALASNRTIATDEDAKIIKELSKYINFKFNAI
jgi:hypothetical protein